MWGSFHVLPAVWHAMCAHMKLVFPPGSVPSDRSTFTLSHGKSSWQSRTYVYMCHHVIMVWDQVKHLWQNCVTAAQSALKCESPSHMSCLIQLLHMSNHFVLNEVFICSILAELCIMETMSLEVCKKIYINSAIYKNSMENNGKISHSSFCAVWCTVSVGKIIGPVFFK